jgi:hypothetical protein
MAYTKNVWLETSMSTVQKIAALDTLENMYGEAVSYIDAITHSSSYYTDAQAAARYFSAVTFATVVGIKDYFGQILQAAGGGDGDFVTGKTSIDGAWERFTFVDAGSGKIAIQVSDGHYVQAAAGGGGDVNCTGDAIGAWEKFTLTDLGGGQYALQASDGHYVSVRGPGGNITADQDVRAEWETFSIFNAQENIVAATLDGYTSDQIMAAGSPSGVIAWWSGSEASIPDGWVLCNGLNGTPDLRNRFVVGAGSHYAKGDSGGANTVTTTGTVTVAGHALTAAEIAKHTHGTIVDNYNVQDHFETSYITWVEYYQLNYTYRNTTSTGSGSAHDHTASWSGTANQDKRPPWYALCYIQKS